MTVGPLHVLVFAFDQPTFTGAALDELRRLENHDVVRLVDLLFVEKDAEGNVAAIEIDAIDPAAAAAFGDLAGALVGVDVDDDGVPDDLDDELWDIADEIPPGSAAAIVLLEHRWAIGLRNALAEAGGELIGDAIVPPEELASLSDEFESAVHERAS